ncbi:hypothetical protein [Streptomyces sp. I05A-00742]|uniref:hypothetical protein n=1 Tax=Streptomyces sp. I05A-00742 TaxID=2732853 RepID=UPI00289FDAEB|nr:hypothetical protein [Streptomyces sp. I05A-00742]
MSRRVSLPGADELFRTTGGVGLQSSAPRRQAKTAEGAAPARVPGPAAAEPDTSAAPATPPEGTARGAGETAEREQDGERRPAADGRERPAPRSAVRAAEPAQPRRRGRAANRRPSGRERHDEKITVYVSAEELMDLEHARLVLRGEHGLAVDRGRIVREAVAVVLADLEARGDASILVRRLRGR